MRTHTSKRVVNKLSRFHTTAGMESFSHPHSQSQNLHNSAQLGHAQSSAAAASSSPPRMNPREFPSSSSATSPDLGAVNSVPGSNGWNNPRSLPLPSPICVTALQQVKQPYLVNSKSIFPSILNFSFYYVSASTCTCKCTYTHVHASQITLYEAQLYFKFAQ